MFLKRKYRKAFEYWQNKSCMHPLTCGSGCGNLELDYIDKDNNLHLYCKHCEYKQIYNLDFIYKYYKEQLKNSKIKFKPFFRWYDLWIGLYIDTKNDSIYIIPFPMIGIKIWRKFKKPFEDLFETKE